MPKTVQDVQNRVLRDVLQVVGVGNSPTAEDMAAVDVSASAAYLHGLRVADLRGDVLANAIPDELFVPFADFVAAQCAVGFGAGVDVAAGLQQRGVDGLNRILAREKFGLPVIIELGLSRGRRGVRIV